jgi:hypothetical protein
MINVRQNVKPLEWDVIPDGMPNLSVGPFYSYSVARWYKEQVRSLCEMRARRTGRPLDEIQRLYEAILQ